jgi:hypothetical protein
MLPYHLGLNLTSSLFPSGFPTKTQHAPLLHMCQTFRSSQTADTFTVKYAFTYYTYFKYAKPSITENVYKENSADLSDFPFSIRIPFMNTNNVLESNHIILQIGSTQLIYLSSQSQFTLSWYICTYNKQLRNTFYF